ncbi:MAG: phosphatidate cytidylyltransferase, partial [Nitrospinae bacterium]|nr:phosphatidate cytidylyltransferase [Nitrospinota bacterium]
MDVKRIISGIVGIPIVLGIILWGNLFAFFAFVLLVTIFCVYEINEMFCKKSLKLPLLFLYGATVILSSTATFCPQYEGIFVSYILFFIAFFIYALLTTQELFDTLKKVSLFAFTLLFVVISLSHLILIYKVELVDKAHYLLFLI